MPESEKGRNTHDQAISDPPPDRKEHPDSKAVAGRPFPVVGLGASAGGLEALKAFFSEVSENSGMAYIVVVHMVANQPSLMPELLQRVAKIPVTPARDGERLQPDHIYVVPPGKEINLYQGTIQLLDLLGTNVSPPIDSFLRSLARDQRSNAVGIILSGTGTDGTLGIKEIKSTEGLVLVQSEKSAKYDGMPRSAISSGVVDMILPPEEMPGRLTQYFGHQVTVKARMAPSLAEDQLNWLNKVFSLLRARVGHDFSAYKKNTLIRRITRRMGLNQVEGHEAYIRFLRETPGEVEALFRELLIGVTSFFRDPPSFDALKTDILPAIFSQMEDDAIFRAWIPGCSTGEEVYSMAMIVQECMAKSAKRINIQLFGTDIDKYAIEKAREGVFPASIRADVAPERLNRFFTREGEFFRIRKEVRDRIIFSVQDVLKDPPFSRLNLLCCRNLLIYLNSDAQKILLPLFHYTLTPGGILVLGSSESIGGFTNLFQTLDSKWKIFMRREVPQPFSHQVAFPSGLPKEVDIAGTAPPIPAGRKIRIGQIAEEMVLDLFSPTAVLIDPRGTILHVRGRTGKYLETTSGPPTQNILDMAREGLGIELSSAIRSASSSGKQVTRKKIRVKTNGGRQAITLHVVPVKTPGESAGRLLVVFEDMDVEPEKGPNPETAAPDGSPDSLPGSLNDPPDTRIAELEKELQDTRESHQTTIEELESSNEELKSTNEELQSSNEELQSTNEELESSKEELQSLNEELQTVNAELQSKVDELFAAHDDMRNLLNSTEIATIFVDNDMRVKRFTQKATAIINLIQTDIGRPLQHVVTNLTYKDMIRDLTDVMEKLIPRDVEVQTTGGQWYNMRIMPYRTTDNRIDGAVLTFSSINDQKNAQSAIESTSIKIRQAWLLIRSILDMNPKPLAVIDQAGVAVTANKAFERLTNIPREQIEGCNVLNIAGGVLKNAGIDVHLKSDLDEGATFKTPAFTIARAEGNKTVFVHGRVIGKKPELLYPFLLYFEETPEEGGK